MTYRPKPIDITGIHLSADLLRLTERLAENVHDLWSLQRLAQGWRHGERRDDGAKEHPCLVPYERLPESEKDIDRNSAMETLKAVIALGYDIVSGPRNGWEERNESAPGDEQVEALVDIKRVVRSLDLPSLIEMWRLRRIDDWSKSPIVYQETGNQFLKLGEPLLGYDVLQEGLQYWPQDVRLKQLKALALARSGATEQAKAILVSLYEAGHRDEETMGLLGRTYKDLAEQSSDEEKRRGYWESAFEVYDESFRLTSGYWSGINAATIACILNDRGRGRELATAVRAACLPEIESAKVEDPDRYWLVATLAEAALIMDDRSEAETHYLEAARMARGRWGDLSSTLRNARLLLEHSGSDVECRATIEQYLWMPRVVVFSGQTVGQSGRSPSSLSLDLAPRVKEAIMAWIRRQRGYVGYSSVATGPDIIFLEAVLELDGEIHLILPCQPDRFVTEIVTAIPSGNWADRFRVLLDKASEIVVSPGENFGTSTVHDDYANRLLLGMAGIRTRQLDTDLLPLALWDGNDESSSSTASAVGIWCSAGLEVTVIDPRRLDEQTISRSTAGPRLDLGAAPTPSPEGDSPQRTVAFLFADTTGFSQLTEKQIPMFIDSFLGLISDSLQKSDCRVLTRETWGDGLYLVFPTVREAGLIGLDLIERTAATDWTAKGLPGHFGLRLALHAGPAYPYFNPITNQAGFMGTHVIQTARIEPIAPPGEVYASQAFAALAFAEGVTDFRCDYVGRISLAKRYGTLPMYHVRRCSDTKTGP